MVEWVSIGLKPGSGPGTQGKCQYLQLGKANLAREAALQKAQSTAGTKMMSLAYFKLAAVPNVFIFSYKSLHIPLNTRK